MRVWLSQDFVQDFVDRLTGRWTNARYLKEGNTDFSLKYFEKAEALTDPANSHLNPEVPARSSSPTVSVSGRLADVCGGARHSCVALRSTGLV